MADYDLDKAIAHLDANAKHGSQSKCARFVRQAIEAGGVNLAGTRHAKDYGKSLIAAGFTQKVPSAVPSKGDVAVIPPVPGHPDGHMAMYDGHQWVSDFRQTHGVYPAAEYRKVKPTVTYYSK